MKVVHISDTHLGYRNFHKTDSDTGINQREQDVYDAFEQSLDRIIDIDPDLILHAGDLFDSVRPTNRAVNKATEQFARLSRAEIPTVVIAGNHDTPKIDTTGTIMGSLKELPEIWAVTSDATDESGGYQTVTIDDMTIHAVSDAPFQEELRNRLEDVQQDEDSEFNVLVLHVGVEDVRDQVYSGEFNEHYVSTGFLESLGMDYVALGHYHKRMRIHGDLNARYCGAIERFSFNESEYEPSFLEVSFGDEISIEEHHLETRPFVRIPELDAETESIDEIVETIRNSLPEEQDQLSEIVFSITVDNIDVQDQSILNERILDTIREQAFETRIQLVSPEGQVSSGEDLEFQDLRVEFEQYLNRTMDDDPDEDILETGQKLLARELGEEDVV